LFFLTHSLASCSVADPPSLPPPEPDPCRDARMLACIDGRRESQEPLYPLQMNKFCTPCSARTVFTSTRNFFPQAWCSTEISTPLACLHGGAMPEIPGPNKKMRYLNLVRRLDRSERLLTTSLNASFQFQKFSLLGRPLAALSKIWP